MGACWGRFLDEWDRQRDDHDDFTNGEWPFVFGASSNRCLTGRYSYLAFKVTCALFMTGILGLSLYDRFITIDCGDKYLIYLTHWALVLQVYYVWISLWASYRASFPSAFTSGYEPMPMSVGTAWVLADITLPLTLFTSLLYWFLVKPNQPGDPGLLTYLTHGANFLVMQLDAFISRIPHHLLHGAYFFAVCAAYVVFSLFYWMFGGTDCSGNHFVIKALDWNHTEKWRTMVGFLWFVAFPVGYIVYLFAASQVCQSQYRVTDTQSSSPWAAATGGGAKRKRGALSCACCSK